MAGNIFHLNYTITLYIGRFQQKATYETHWFRQDISLEFIIFAHLL